MPTIHHQKCNITKYCHRSMRVRDQFRIKSMSRSKSANITTVQADGNKSKATKKTMWTKKSHCATPATHPRYKDAH